MTKGRESLGIRSHRYVVILEPEIPELSGKGIGEGNAEHHPDGQVLMKMKKKSILMTVKMKTSNEEVAMRTGHAMAASKKTPSTAGS